MPDLLVHTFSGLILNRLKTGPVKITEKAGKPLFLFLMGNILPDVFSKAPRILFPGLGAFFDAYHTPAGSLALCFLVSLFFEETRRKAVFLCFFAGAVFHLALDLIQKDIFGGGYKIFFPLRHEFNIGLVWPEDSIYSIPALFIIICIIYRKDIARVIRRGREELFS
ncbi:MAG: hypothetical protein JXJ19_00710 [Elusimicrobia bacterium]|nr:hypothetical protein [Elusimicrobiota bacterium]